MTLQAKDLRCGNLVTDAYYDTFQKVITVESIHPKGINVFASDDNKPYGMHNGTLEVEHDFEAEHNSLQGIPLTSEWLERFGAQSIPHFTVGNTKFFDLGRNRQLSVSCAGTPNCMVFLQDMENNSRHEGNNPIVLHNYDYDGPLHVHTFQNLFFALTGEELTIKEKNECGEKTLEIKEGEE